MRYTHVGAAFLALAVASCEVMAAEPDIWIHDLAAIPVACLSSESGSDEAPTDLTMPLQTALVEARVRTIGVPFVTELGADDARVRWETCAPFGAGVLPATVSTRTLNPSPVAIAACEGTSADAARRCLERLQEKIGAGESLPPHRTVPILTADPIDRTELRKRLVARLSDPSELTLTRPDQAGDTIAGTDDTERRLLGEDKTPRSLISPPAPSVPERGGPLAQRGIALWLPLTAAQRAAIESR